MIRRLRALRRRALARAVGGLAELRRRIARPEAVFLGDSITQFWLDEDPALFGTRRLNRGNSGETTREMLARFDRDVIAHRPRLVHIMAGTNDLWHGDPGPDATIALANLREMIGQARAHGIRVVLAAPPPIAAYAEPLFRTPELYAPLLAGIRRLAASAGATHVDYAAALLAPDGQPVPRYTSDGVHLTRAGYRAMRAQAEASLRTARSRP